MSCPVCVLQLDHCSLPGTIVDDTELRSTHQTWCHPLLRRDHLRPVQAGFTEQQVGDVIWETRSSDLGLENSLSALMVDHLCGWGSVLC